MLSFNYFLFRLKRWTKLNFSLILLVLEGVNHAVNYSVDCNVILLLYDGGPAVKL